MRVLLDTCVLSEILRPKGHPRVRRAVEALDSEDLFLSVVSIGEIANGIALLKDTKKKDDLLVWMQALEADYADRILVVDVETSHIWGELTAERNGPARVFRLAMVSSRRPRVVTVFTS